MKNQEIQQIAVDTIEYIRRHIYAGQSLKEIRTLCENKMLELGATSFWYYNIGAFVFAGKDTTISVSGRKYKTVDYSIKPNDIITIDLSPSYRNIWGDYARTIIIENGKVADCVYEISDLQWRNGLLFEDDLHKELMGFVTLSTTFEEVYYHMNNMIMENGYKNLDFNGNLGHSIEKFKYRRVYIEKGNKKLLSKSKFFTFEPHIALINGDYGFKKENIYYFDGGVLKRL